MKPLIRGLVVFFTAVATFYFVYWVGGALLASLGLPVMVATLAAVFLAVAVARFVWRRSASVPGGLASSVVTGALVIGAVGFVAGFFGPMVFTPGANQGPMLGIFLTGPVGFLLGAIAGGVHWLARRSRTSGTGVPT